MSDQQSPQNPQEPQQPEGAGSTPGGRPQPPTGPGFAAPPPTGPGFSAPPPTGPGFSAPPPPGGGYPTPPPNPQGSYGMTPGYGGGVPQALPQTNNSAIVAFVLAIVSWVLCPLVAAIIALVFASKAKKEIETSGGWQTGEGFATAAKIISWINIAVTILIVLFYIVVIVIIIGTGNSTVPSRTF